MKEEYKVVRSPIVKDEELPEVHFHNDLDQPAINLGDLPLGTDHSTLSNVTIDQHHARDHASRHAPGGGDALSLTSSQMASIVTDETGSGALVFATSPTLVTPTLGVASATSLTSTGNILSYSVKLTGNYIFVGFSEPVNHLCDGTADNVEIQAALDAASAAGGGVVHLKVGTYSLSKFVKVPTNVILEGEGFGTLLKLADNSINSGVTDTWTRQAVIIPGSITTNPPTTYATTYGCQVRNLKVDANRAGQTSLIANELYGVQFQWVNNARIENVWVINAHSSGIGVWPSNPVTKVDAETIVSGCRTENNNASVAGQTLDAGIFVSNGTSQPSKVIVSDCISLGNRNGYCIEDTNGGVMINNCVGASNTAYGLTFHTATHCTVNGGFFYLNTLDGIGITGAGERWHTLNGVQCYYNGRYGANLGHDYSIVGGQFVWNGDAGIVINSTVNNTITGAMIAGNGAGASPTFPYGVYIVHGSLTDQNTITGCFFGQDTNSKRTNNSQTHGIFESGACSGLYTANTFSIYDTVQTPIAFGVGSVSKASNNSGLNPLGLHAQGNITGATTFTRVNGSVITATLTGNVTTTITAGIVKGDDLTLVLTQDGTGSRTWTIASNFKPSGGVLTLSTGASKVDVIKMVWDGTNWQEVSRSMDLGGSGGQYFGDTTLIASITGNAATVTTNANLTGHITSTGNAAVLGSFTLAQLNTAVSDADIAPIASPTFTGTLTAPTIVSTTVVRLKSYTVATLPAGTQGDTAFATDLSTPTYLGTAVGGGAVIGTVFYNGVNWVCT